MINDIEWLEGSTEHMPKGFRQSNKMDQETKTWDTDLKIQEATSQIVGKQ